MSEFGDICRINGRAEFEGWWKLNFSKKTKHIARDAYMCGYRSGFLSGKEESLRAALIALNAVLADQVCVNNIEAVAASLGNMIERMRKDDCRDESFRYCK